MLTALERSCTTELSSQCSVHTLVVCNSAEFTLLPYCANARALLTDPKRPKLFLLNTLPWTSSSRPSTLSGSHRGLTLVNLVLRSATPVIYLHHIITMSSEDQRCPKATCISAIFRACMPQITIASPSQQEQRGSSTSHYTGSSFLLRRISS